MTGNKEKTINDDFQNTAHGNLYCENQASNMGESLLPDSGKIEIQVTSSKIADTIDEQNSKILVYKQKKLKKREKISQPCGKENMIYLRLLSSFLCLFVVWGILYTIMEKEVLPGGKLLTLILLLAASYVAGDIFKLIGLPKLIGMLLSGIIMRNTGLYFNTKDKDVYSNVVAIARQVALTCILITAGLELDAKSLKKLSLVVFELSFIPCIIEAIGVAICCRFILDLSWPWGMLIGFIMGAVTPAIVVPTLMSLQKKGYDSDNKISTIVIAAASFDDIVAISGFGIFFGIIFNEGSTLNKIIHGPVELIGGLICGIGWGIFAAWLPHPKDNHVVAKRIFIVGGGSLFFVLGSSLFGYDGTGTLASIVSAFVACICWKWQGWSPSYNPVKDVFNSLWIILEPALFGLIGAEIDFGIIKMDQITQGLFVILGGLLFRAVACTAVLLTADVTFKELLFINVAWTPKATVQAALGSLALDRAKGTTPLIQNNVEYGEIALMIAVLSILLTAPIGAIGITTLGRVLLKRDSIPVAQSDHT